MTALLVGGILAVGLVAPAHALNMFAGPLFPNGDLDSCSCQIVNVTTSAKTIQIQLLNKDGGLIAGGTAPVQVDAGEVATVNGTIGGAQYCKFVNASPTNFRAVISCTFGCATGASHCTQVAVPAR